MSIVAFRTQQEAVDACMRAIHGEKPEGWITEVRVWRFNPTVAAHIAAPWTFRYQMTYQRNDDTDRRQDRVKLMADLLRAVPDGDGRIEL